MIMYENFHSLFERFAIMTADGDYSDQFALKYLKDKTTQEAYNELISFLQEYEKKHENNDKASLHADIETLSKYIKAGFQLFPCYEKTPDTYSYIMLNGKFKLYENDEAKARKERKGIKDIETLKEVIQSGITDQYGKCHKIDYFRIFPLDNQKQRYIVIDIDHHEGKGNGFPQWRNYLKSKHLEGIDYLYNLEKFPCYVKSANEGVHLYFKLIDFPTPENIKNLTQNVEVKGFNSAITAGGTYREASKNKFYKLYGDFENAPAMPMEIFIDIQSTEKEREFKQLKPKIKPLNKINKYEITSKSWNSTLESMYDKALIKNTGGNHDLIVLFCTYVKYAIQDGKINTSRNEVEDFLYHCPEVLQHEKGEDKGDTKHIINDYIKE